MLYGEGGGGGHASLPKRRLCTKRFTWNGGVEVKVDLEKYIHPFL